MLQHSIWQVGCGLSQAILEPFSSAWVKDKQGHLPGGNCFQVKKVRCPARGSKHFTLFGFGRQKSLFLTKCAKSLLSRFVCWSRPCCRSFLCVFRCLTSMITILPDPRAYEPLVSLITSQQATQDLNWTGITAPSAWRRRLCGRFQEKSHNNSSGDASALIFFAVVLFCELLTGKSTFCIPVAPWVLAM